MDEPFSALDPLIRRERVRKTILFVSHVQTGTGLDIRRRRLGRR
jgi:ABC-type proline/glycine betaine transport system ATPase subunit